MNVIENVAHQNIYIGRAFLIHIWNVKFGHIPTGRYRSRVLLVCVLRGFPLNPYIYIYPTSIPIFYNSIA